MSASPAPPGARVLVLGVGNPLMSDDGVGQRLLAALTERLPALDCVEYLDAGTLGFMLLPRIEQCDALLALDAASLDAAPGTVRVFEGEGLDAFLRTPRCSVHELGLRDLLDAARPTGSLPARRALVGVQPARLGWGMALSPDVEAALPAAAHAARRILERWLAAAGRARIVVAHTEHSLVILRRSAIHRGAHGVADCVNRHQAASVGCA